MDEATVDQRKEDDRITTGSDATETRGRVSVEHWVNGAWLVDQPSTDDRHERLLQKQRAAILRFHREHSIPPYGEAVRLLRHAKQVPYINHKRVPYTCKVHELLKSIWSEPMDNRAIRAVGLEVANRTGADGLHHALHAYNTLCGHVFHSKGLCQEFDPEEFMGLYLEHRQWAWAGIAGWTVPTEGWL
ncbi:MAG: hypothetical protein KVP17_004032 [Porospora cf. gigantea B]|uniref:uncharacterized protein n=1 Tax=Porospora cf. gigantea B TaxID=2853592 RepID=UPI003571D093|nr:MAG: hypothetical protein KVP17_004032 [Porospora cf. gigantea B]